jgi:hypothetical protein
MRWSMRRDAEASFALPSGGDFDLAAEVPGFFAPEPLLDFAFVVPEVRLLPVGRFMMTEAP